MEDSQNHLEALLQTATEYGKTNYQLAKLKLIDKTSNVVSSIVPLIIVFAILSSCMLFCSLGVAFWLGDMLEKVYYGFFVVAGFYCFIGFVIHFILHKKLKKVICNYIIKLALN